MKKYKMLAVCLAAVMALSACGQKASTEKPAENADQESTAGLANPWTETDQAGILEATGFELAAPEGAEDVQYSYLADEGLAQVSYVLDSTNWVYRLQSANELKDISGCNYEWDAEEQGKVSYCDAEYRSYVNENGDDVQTVNWYDVVPGVTYSLSATAEDLDGMDIQVYAEQVFAPTQGDSYGDEELETQAEIQDYFLGEHTRDEDGSTLLIEANEDGTYKVNLSVIRLCSLEDGVGTLKDHKMTFTVDDPNGNPMTGIIYRDGENHLTVEFTDSTWDYLPNGEQLTGF